MSKPTFYVMEEYLSEDGTGPHKYKDHSVDPSDAVIFLAERQRKPHVRGRVLCYSDDGETVYNDVRDLVAERMN